VKSAPVAWATLLLCLACTPAADAPAFDLPARPADAPGGAAIARAIRDLEFEAREALIHDQVARGNVPESMRQLRKVEISGAVGGRTRRVTLWVMPDYLSVGSDDDQYLIPLSPRTAHRIAELVGGSLPTPGIVDAVWASARVKLMPIRIPPDEFMRSPRYFERHSQMVQAQRWLHRARPGVLVAGHKLDVVLPAAPSGDSAEAGLYGWHMPDGTPIQPLFRVGMDDPPPFSVGVRLVHRRILIDGASGDLREAVRDPELAPLLAGTAHQGRTGSQPAMAPARPARPARAASAGPWAVSAVLTNVVSPR
jgi:hypothetical protein